MTVSVTQHEWELLSAYADGQVSDSERIHIEQRLISDLEFSDAYTSLIKTRAILNAAPRVKRRRNFYLNPQMIQSRSRGWVIPVLNFGSAMAAVFAVLLFALDVFQPSPLFIRSNMAAEQAPLVQDYSAAPVDSGAEESSIIEDRATEKMENAPEMETLPLGVETLPGGTQAGEMQTAPMESAAEMPQGMTAQSQPEEDPLVMAAPALQEAPAAEVPSSPSEGALEPALPVLPDGIQPADNQPELEKAAPAEIAREAAGSTAAPLEMEAVPPPSDSPIPSVTPFGFSEPAQKAAGNLTAPQEESSDLLPDQSSLPEEILPTAARISTPIPVSPISIAKVESRVRVAWVILLSISGLLALASLILRKKSSL